MSFACPECRRPDTLKITDAIELPADARSDEITLQTVACGACPFRGIAAYEESRRGALDSDAWTHGGYHADPRIVAWLAGLIAACPAPANRLCECASHRTLRRHYENGSWHNLEWVGEYFVMRLA